MQTKTNLGVIGSREYSNFPKFARTLAAKISELGGPHAVRIISGGARGPDTWARKFAKSWNIEYKEYPAQWRIDGVYNSQAGLNRNTLIVNDSDFVLAFYDGKSNGTYDSFFKDDWSGTPHEVIDET